ncbi:MAG: enoyl-CoA hydratase/isomerase family protein [Promethearchaeota archaeon]|jgi:enoyl-CoA hydratase
MNEIVKYEKEGDIGKIILNNPDNNNALDLLTVKKLIEAFEKSAQNDDICVIYSAEGRDFTVGADLKYGFNLISKPENLQESIEFLESFQELTRAMLAHTGIIIAGIHGWVIGGGFEQLLSCDLRIAAEDTRIMMPELGVGLFFSNASTKLLPRIIGEGRAKQLMYLGKEINAEEAYNIGLVSQVCKREGLKRNLKRTANLLIQKEHLALKSAKKLLNEDQDENFESVLAKELRVMMLTGQSEELKRRLEKFVKK